MRDALRRNDLLKALKPLKETLSTIEDQLSDFAQMMMNGESFYHVEMGNRLKFLESDDVGRAKELTLSVKGGQTFEEISDVHFTE